MCATDRQDVPSPRARPAVRARAAPEAVAPEAVAPEAVAPEAVAAVVVSPVAAGEADPREIGAADAAWPATALAPLEERALALTEE
jgi:hypothetical protein